MKGKYLYGIVNGSVEDKFSTRGLFNKRPYLIHYNSISAIVTDAPMKTYEPDQKGLLSHNSVLDEVIKLYTVIPMRFGTIARSEDEVKGLLRNTYSVLRDRLSKIKDKVEFNLAINIDEGPVLKEIIGNNKEIRDLRDKLISQGAGADRQSHPVDMGDKILIGQMIAEEVTKYKAGIIKAIDAALKPYYSRFKPLTKKDALANIAFLVRRNHIKQFESAIYKLGDKYGDRLKFKYAGPLAPYSFVEMNMLVINFEKLDKARRELQLGEKAAFKDIKEAYRKLAREYHPDATPGDSSKEEEFKKISDSYKLLYEYCRHYPKNQYEFKPGAINEVSVISYEQL